MKDIVYTTNSISDESPRPSYIQRELLRLKHAAAYLGVSLPTLYRLSETDPTFPEKVRYSKRCCFYNRVDLDTWMASKGVA